LAARLPTLVAAVVPVAVGVACAARAGAVSIPAIVAALLGAVWIQIGTNLANDAADFERGADASDRLGPLRAAQAGLLTPAQLRRGVVVAFGIAALVGCELIALRGWPIVGIGVTSILAGVAYTAGPFPLAYHGLGEVFVLLFFGTVAVCGSAFAASGVVPPVAWLAAVPVGALATMLLVVNNVRDRTSDERAGKRTLIVRYGRRFGEIEYALLAAAVYATPLLGVTIGWCGWPALLAVLTAPLAARLYGRLRHEDGAALNGLLRATARFLLLHGLLWGTVLSWA
jgi:1,4-dihydroxy-2-naphthoate octaprenyltransferase